MAQNTRIYNRFSGYTAEDCRCEWCLHYGGKDRPCLLTECCWTGYTRLDRKDKVLLK